METASCVIPAAAASPIICWYSEHPTTHLNPVKEADWWEQRTVHGGPKSKLRHICLTTLLRKIKLIIRPPGNGSSGRPYVLQQMFIFYFSISRQNLRASLADRRETLPRDQYLAEFYNASAKIRGPSPKKLRAKNMYNLGRFYCFLHNFRFWSWISPEWDKTSKIGKTCDRERFLPRLVKYIRWHLVHYPESRTCEFGPTKIDFFRNYISASRGLAPEIFTRARHWPRLASAYHKAYRGHLQKLNANT